MEKYKPKKKKKRKEKEKHSHAQVKKGVCMNKEFPIITNIHGFVQFLKSNMEKNVEENDFLIVDCHMKSTKENKI